MKKIYLFFTFILSVGFFFGNINSSFADDGNHQRYSSGGVIEILPNSNYTISFGNELQSITFSKTTDLSIKTLESGIWKDVNANSSSYVPLQGYIISNYSQTPTYVTYTYKANINGGSALLQKKLFPGWNLVGVSKNDGEVGYDLYSLEEVFGNNLDYRYVVDFSESAFGTGTHTIRFDTNYHVKSKGQTAYLSEGKAYAIFIESSGLYAGFQNTTDNLGNIEYAYKTSDFIFSNTGSITQVISTGSVEVTLAEGNIRSLYNVILGDFSINYSLNGFTNSGVNQIFSDFILDIDGEQFPTVLNSSGAIQFSFNKVVGKDSNIKITAKTIHNSQNFIFELESITPLNFSKKYSWNNSFVNLFQGTILSNIINYGDFDTKGTLSSSDANPKASLLLAGDKDQKVLAFRVKAENDSVKLRDVVFSGTNLDNLSNFRLLTPTNKYVASTSNTATNVEFKTLELDDAVAMNNTDTYYLVADVNTNVHASFSVVLDKSLTIVKGSNGSIISVEGENIFSNTHLVAENKAVVAKSSNASKDISTSALRFSVTASGKDQVTLSGASFDNVLSGYTGSATLTVYKDSVSMSNKVGELSASTGVVSFTANKTVNAGSTNNYIVVVEGVVIDSNANTLSWTVRLSDLEVVSGSANISAKAYNNMGEFPLTETK